MGGKDAVASYIMFSASSGNEELPRAGGPVRVGLCRDSASSNSTPMRGVGGSRDGGVYFAQIIFHFFYCYINMLKGAFKLVSTSNGCIWHCKFDVNVKKAMFLSLRRDRRKKMIFGTPLIPLHKTFQLFYLM